MKTIIILIGLFFQAKLVIAQTSISQISIKNLQNADILLSTLSGKKIIIFTSDAGNPDFKFLSELQNFYNKNKNQVNIILVPVLDFTDKALPSIKDQWNTIKVDFNVSSFVYGSKSTNKQNDLIKWLTNKSENRHYDDNIDQGGDAFFISENGILFGCMKGKVDLNGPQLKKILATQLPDIN